MYIAIILATIGLIILVLGILGSTLRRGEDRQLLFPASIRISAILVGLILLAAGAVMGYPRISQALAAAAPVAPSVTKSVAPTTSTPTLEATPIPSPSLTSTVTQPPTLTPTLQFLPPALNDIFPQVDGGTPFTYALGGGIINDLYIRSPDCIHSGSFGLQLTFALAYPQSSGWGIDWTKSSTGHFDLSAFNNLNFWVKGMNGNEIFQLEMVDTTGKQAWAESYQGVRVKTDWTQASFPLTDFKTADLANLASLRFNFNSDYGYGSLCIDDIALSK